MCAVPAGRSTPATAGRGQSSGHIVARGAGLPPQGNGASPDRSGQLYRPGRERTGGFRSRHRSCRRGGGAPPAGIDGNPAHVVRGRGQRARGRPPQHRSFRQADDPLQAVGTIRRSRAGARVHGVRAAGGRRTSAARAGAGGIRATGAHAARATAGRARAGRTRAGCARADGARAGGARAASVLPVGTIRREEDRIGRTTTGSVRGSASSCPTCSA